jgi:hypothetical protein
VDLNHPAKATLSDFQSFPQIIEIIVAAPLSMQVFATETMLSITTVQIVHAASRVNQSRYECIG